MINSIRWRLFIGMTLLVGFFVFFSWLLNTNYLEKYYVHEKTAQLSKQSQYITRLFTEPPDDMLVQLRILERRENLTILVIQPDLNIIYASLNTDSGVTEFDIVLEQLRQAELTGQAVQITGDPFNNERSLNMYSRFGEHDYLIVSTPLEPIQESVAIANKFFLYTGLITLIIATLVVFLFSRRFTRPIVEMNGIAQRMAHLDFSRKYPVTSHDELGELGSSINSLSDQLSKAIGELQDANARLRKDIEKERRIDEMRKEFISSVSHELKTPLALIQGYAEGLKVNVAEKQEDKDFYCSVIIDEANKMNKLVKGLLDLSQVEAEVFTLERSTFDVSLLIDNVIAKYGPLFEEKEVQLEKAKPESILVDADITRTEQILTNYLNNALDHLDGDRLIKLEAEIRDNKAYLAVYNSGEPIPESALDKVFISFYKSDPARTRTDGSYGLGLAIVRAIQEKDHNSYGVENLSGGVQFWFQLDLAVPEDYL
jgi:signal transduction histidine kinase